MKRVTDGRRSPSSRWRQLAVVDLGPLRRHREYRLLWIGQAVTGFGSMISAVAITYQVYQLTHSTLMVGLLDLLAFLPLLAMGLLGGAYADAHDRRRLVLLAEVAFALAAALLAFNSLLPHPLLLVIFVVDFVRSGLYGLQRPPLDALLPRLVPTEELAAAGALNTVRGTIAMIGGPAVGGIVIALAGLPAAYALDVATFGFSLAMLVMMRAVPPPAGAEAPSLGRVKEGLRYALGRPELLGTYGVDMVAMFFGMPMALFPAIADRLGGPAVLGLLTAAPAAGSFLTSATSGWTRTVHRHGLAVVLAAAAWGLVIAVFGLVTWLPLALALLVLTGALDTVSGIFRQVIWNQTIPDRLRGRLAGIELVSYTSGPALGNFEAGAVAAVFGVPAAIISGGVLCVAGVVAVAAALPRFRAYDSRTWMPAPLD